MVMTNLKTFELLFKSNNVHQGSKQHTCLLIFSNKKRVLRHFPPAWARFSPRQRNVVACPASHPKWMVCVLCSPGCGGWWHQSYLRTAGTFFVSNGDGSSLHHLPSMETIVKKSFLARFLLLQGQARRLLEQQQQRTSIVATICRHMLSSSAWFFKKKSFAGSPKQPSY